MPTLNDFASNELDKAKARQQTAQDQLKSVNLDLAAASKTRDDALKKLTEAQRAARDIRRKLAEIPMPADGDALLADLQAKILDARSNETQGLDAEKTVAILRARADRAAADVARATADVASASAAKAEAEKKQAEYANIADPKKPKGWKPTATTDLAGLPQDAKDLLHDVARNQDYVAAKARVKGDIPAELLARARERLTSLRAADADAASEADAKEDELAVELALNGGKTGEVAERLVTFTRAETALRSFALNARDEMEQALKALQAISKAPPLSAPVRARIGALKAKGVAAIPKEQARDAARGDLAAKQASLDARIAVVRTGGGDPDTDAQVVDLRGKVAAAQADLTAKQTDLDAVQGDLDVWEAAIPDDAWASLYALEEAQGTLERLGAIVPGDLVDEFNAAESDYAAALAEAADAQRRARTLEDDHALRAAYVGLLLDSKRRRGIAALRGDR